MMTMIILNDNDDDDDDYDDNDDDKDDDAGRLRVICAGVCSRVCQEG